MCDLSGIHAEKPIEMLELLHYQMMAGQHRGQEASGVLLSDGNRCISELHIRRLSGGTNSVNHLFAKKSMPGRETKLTLAIGHNRYSTAGSIAKNENTQPLLAKTKYGLVGVGHNGNLPYAGDKRAELEQDGSIFISDSDTELILVLISRSKRETLEEAIIEALGQVRGSYSLLFMTKDKMIAVRDPYGFRPLVLGEHDYGYTISSETCAFSEEEWGVRFVREINRGEMVVIEGNKMYSIVLPHMPQFAAHCVFELIYFARPDSFMFGHSVADFRIETGRLHAKRYPLDVEAVVSVPDSANYFAEGHAAELGVPVALALLRNHYSGRNFINPKRKSIYHKLSPIRSRIENKALSLDDDSIVRADTSRQVVRMVRTCRPRSIDFSVASPPVRGRCPYGIDIKNELELATNGRDVEGIRQMIDSDSLNYLDMADLRAAVRSPKDFCFACFLGKEYPV